MKSFKTVKTGIAILLLVLFCAGVSSAADKKKDQIRKKDGSCLSYSLSGESNGIELAKSQIRKKDTKKDGSC